MKSSGSSFRQRAIPAYAGRRCKTASIGRGGVLAGLRSKIESVIHEGEQLLPTGEVKVAGQRSQVVEKGAAGSQFTAYSLIHQTAEVQDAMEEEGQNQEGQ